MHLLKKIKNCIGGSGTCQHLNQYICSQCHASKINPFKRFLKNYEYIWVMVSETIMSMKQLLFNSNNYFNVYSKN